MMLNSEEMLPSVYQQSWDMRTMCRIFDMEFDLLKYYTEHILDCYSPENCPDSLLDELAEHIGFEYQKRKSIMYNRIVLKNFIRHLIRYRGSATGIRNAAAIDIRYNEKYPEERFDIETGDWVPDERAGEPIPMSYYEGLSINKTWMDTDSKAGIIYLFLVVSDYFPSVKTDMTDEERQAAHSERMRKLLDLAYLQEYVRPVGMYLLPMVAEKVNPKTDLTVKAVRIRDAELGWNNGVRGIPNASMQRPYDRIHFAHLEDGTLNTEPWVRTLYHSQLAGEVSHQYFSQPVYHIEGKFLYYDHDELQEIYQNRTDVTVRKLGDSLYNPLRNEPSAYSYGPLVEDEPGSIQSSLNPNFANITGTASGGYPFAYDDHGVFGDIPRTWQEIPLGFDDLGSYYITGDYQNEYPTYLASEPEDDGTNKNMMINLFDDERNPEPEDPEGPRPIQGPYDIVISGKEPTDRRPVPYEHGSELNIETSGDDIFYTVHYDDEDPTELIP